MNIVEIEAVFNSGDRQKIELMARTILVRGRSHHFMQELSKHAKKFRDLLSKTPMEDRDYFALVYILAEHLQEISNGACACSIVEKPMFNSPDRLDGILVVLDERVNPLYNSLSVHSKCLACGSEYLSEVIDSGFGQKVIWKDYN